LKKVIIAILFSETILIFLLSGSFAGTPENSGVVTVTMTQIKPEQGGNMIIALYRSEEGWPDLEKAFLKRAITVKADSLTARFEAVPYDSGYAVQVFHDKNSNGKLDFRFFPFPMPKEGAGVSNNNTRNGPPLYKKAVFGHFTGNTAIRIIMRY